MADLDELISRAASLARQAPRTTKAASGTPRGKFGAVLHKVAALVRKHADAQDPESVADAPLPLPADAVPRDTTGFREFLRRTAAAIRVEAVKEDEVLTAEDDHTTKKAARQALGLKILLGDRS